MWKAWFAVAYFGLLLLLVLFALLFGTFATGCASVHADTTKVVHGEILDRKEGGGMDATGEWQRRFWFSVGYRNLEGTYELRPFLLSQIEVLRAGIAGRSEICVNLAAWPQLVSCP